MNARIKQLALQGGMELSKVQSLIDLYDGDELFVEQVMLGADATQKAAQAQGVAYKVAYKAAPAKRTPIAPARKADDGLDPIDEAYIQLRDALDVEDAEGVQTALAQLTQLVGNSIDQSTTKAARRDPLVAVMRQWLG